MGYYKDSITEWLNNNEDSINNQKLSIDQQVYTENFRLLTAKKYEFIVSNVNANQDFKNIRYDDNSRVIVTKAAVPFSRPLYLKFTLPSQGYPFNDINVSSSLDKKWVLILSDSFYSWVKADIVSRISNTQINNWSLAFKKDRLSVWSFDTAITSTDEKSFIADAYPGTI